MERVRGVHCCAWVSLATLLYGTPANLDSEVAATLGHLGDRLTIAQSDAASVSQHVRVPLADQDVPSAPADGHVSAGRFAARDAALADASVQVALADPQSQIIAEPSYQLASVAPDARVPPLPPLQPLDDCPAKEACIDQYLFQLYERARKVDTVKVQERIKVTVKKKGKTRTVVKTTTKLVDEDFTWKDPDAAEKVGMSVPDYVFGGMDRGFKVKLYHLMRALDEAGLEPGITSGFRDDYRQSIASGNKAATGHSYHGGSRRGGYGHGLAADVVSVKGKTRAERWETSDILWKWIDENGHQYGVGRPYLDRDPPHLAPIDGKEYVAKRRVREAGR
jgi:hypothetical protein